MSPPLSNTYTRGLPLQVPTTGLLTPGSCLAGGEDGLLLSFDADTVRPWTNKRICDPTRFKSRRPSVCVSFAASLGPRVRSMSSAELERQTLSSDLWLLAFLQAAGHSFLYLCR